MSRRRVGGLELYVEEGGAGRPGGPTLLLCHGLTGTGAVWQGLRDRLERDWPGRWIIPDLRGHGRSDHAAIYGIAMHAADMAALVAGDERVVVAGHSMGGLVGIALATGWFGAAVTDVLTLGVKVAWTDEERGQIARVTGAPVRWLDTRAEAAERFLKVAGLAGLAAPDSALANSGVSEEGGKFRLAADMRAGLVAEIEPPEIYAIAKHRARIVLSCGEHDRMVSIAELRGLDPEAVVHSGLGHNAHVEDAEPFWRLIAAAANL